MNVTALKLNNFRSFMSMEPISLGQVNILVGANNAGKSSILRALHTMQVGSQHSIADIRIGHKLAEINIWLDKVDTAKHWGEHGIVEKNELNISLINQGGLNLGYALGGRRMNPIPNIEPKHFIVPYLSKRKTAGYHEDVRVQHGAQISNDFQFLSAKLAKLSTPGFPRHTKYRETCERILGFLVVAIQSEGGMRPGVFLPDGQAIFIEQMGEGVPNIVALLADLALSEGKLFIIEEPENDLHPEALKALLDLIIESSASNQFVISTHSNIVVRHLGSVSNSKLYSITTVPDSFPPEAIIQDVIPTAEARLAILRDLGYSFSDFELWDGWLILEESSAERIIRDYLIPMFVPKLTRVRTLSTGGVNQVEPTFEDFNRMVRFTHLEESYRDLAWVRVDGDTSGLSTVEKLKQSYSSWSPDRFSTYSSPQFESYYPKAFDEEVKACFAIQDKQKKREAKRVLLEKVRAWLDEDANRARSALEESAAEIITDLKTIAGQLR